MQPALASVVVLVALTGLLVFAPGPGSAAPTSTHAPSVAPRLTDAVVPSVPGRPVTSPDSSGGASIRMLVTTADRASVPNVGLATNLTAFPGTTYPANSSFQTGAEEVIGTYEAVFGLFTNDQTVPTAFYAIFSNTSDQSVRLEYWAGLSVFSGAAYDFQLVESNGTVWSLSVNGEPFGDSATASTFDFGARESTWIGGIGFSEVAIYSDTTTVPVSFVATTALAVERPGGSWYLPVNGTANFTGPSSAAYGIEGRSQMSEFAPGEVASGTSLAAVRATEVLWTTGPVPVDVGVELSSATVSGLGVVNVQVNVSSPSAVPLGTVPVYVEDSLGGNATPSTVYTEADGVAATILVLPNESSTVGTTVRAVVTILGFVGSGSTGLTIEPSVQVIVTPNSAHLSIAPDANGTVTFQTSTTTGQPYPGVALTISSGAPGTGGGPPEAAGVVPEPSAGTTDLSGSLAVVLTAPPIAGSYAIVAVVSDFGVWGQATVHVSVEAPPPTLWQRYGPSVIVPALVIGLVAVVLIALVVMVRRRRGPRQSLPDMDLRKLREGGVDRTSGPPADGGPVSRRPPASGSP
jgi:hypothetical protein